jgi:hypothetical protein
MISLRRRLRLRRSYEPIPTCDLMTLRSTGQSPLAEDRKWLEEYFKQITEEPRANSQDYCALDNKNYQ